MINSTEICVDVENYFQIFSSLIKKYSLSQSEVSRRCGLPQATVSRLCLGQNIVASSFFQILLSMPFDFQRDYVTLMFGHLFAGDDLSSRISTASRLEMKKILLAMADRFVEVEKND